MAKAPRTRCVGGLRLAESLDMLHRSLPPRLGRWSRVVRMVRSLSRGFVLKPRSHRCISLKNATDTCYGRIARLCEPSKLRGVLGAGP